MRKVVLGLGISLDGYIARPDGAVDFLFMPKDYSMGPFFATIDTAIMGRKTYDDALKMGGGGFSGSKMKNFVFSHSQPPRDFLKDDVVDELYIGIVPILIGEGLPLFPSGFPQREFTLLENKTFSKGLIALKYARARKKPKRK